jgi:Pectate lyase superfamily protein
LSVGTWVGPANVNGMGVFDVREHGAVGDGVTDDHEAVMAAVTAADDAGGGTVFFPAGTYAVSASLGRADPPISRACLLGDGDRAARILATGAFAPITGSWFMSRFENLMIDAGGHGGPGMVVDLDKSYVRHCWVRDWTDYGISCNPTREGLLNWIDDTFVEQHKGTGIHTTYRFYDSWIVNNNVGSEGPNLSLESGPVRVLANHLNGSPRHNIELRGNRLLTIIGNICEGARREAIVYRMPDWLDADSPQIEIVGNNISNGGKEKPKRYPAIGIYSRDAGRRTGGFNITGNFFACTDDDADWTYAVDAEHVDMLAITGNQWESRGFTTAPVNVGGTGVSVSGNSSGNDGRVVAALTAPTTLTATSGDRAYFLSDGASVTLPPAAGNTCRLTCKNLSGSGTKVAASRGETVDRQSGITVTPGQTVEMLSDGKAWWTL